MLDDDDEVVEAGHVSAIDTGTDDTRWWSAWSRSAPPPNTNSRIGERHGCLSTGSKTQN